MIALLDTTTMVIWGAGYTLAEAQRLAADSIASKIPSIRPCNALVPIPMTEFDDWRNASNNEFLAHCDTEAKGVAQQESLF
jgi:hypothetical protein